MVSFWRTGEPRSTNSPTMYYAVGMGGMLVRSMIRYARLELR